MSESELRRQFLILSARDIEYYPEHHIAKKRLIKEGSKAAEVAVTYIERDDPGKLVAIETVVVGVGEDAIPPLLKVLSNPDQDAASFAAYLLGEIGGRETAVPLMLAAKSSNIRLRSVAIGALGKCEDTTATPILLEALSDSLPSVRRRAASSLGELGDSRAVDKLISLLEDSSASVRYTASYALAKIGDGEVTLILLSKIEENNGGSLGRYHIIETLGMLRDESAVPVLLDLLDDPLYLNRGFACQALGHFRGNYRVANALKRSLNDASEFVRMMAGNALLSIRGH